MPNITVALDAIIHDSRVQWDVYNSSRAEVTSNIPIRPNKTMAVRQFEAMFMYTSALRRILVKMAENIKVSIMSLQLLFIVCLVMPKAKITWCDFQYLVDEETKSIKDKIKWPIIMMVGLGISIPIIIYLSSKASYSMRSSSKRFDEQALSLNLERRKTDGLLSQLLPADIISMLKTGFQILNNSCYWSNTVKRGPLGPVIMGSFIFKVSNFRTTAETPIIQER